MRGRATGWVAACTKAGGLGAQAITISALTPSLGNAAIAIALPSVAALLLVAWFGRETRVGTFANWTPPSSSMFDARRIGLALLALLALIAAPVRAQHDGRAWQRAASLHRGVNIIGYDPIWKDPAKARFKWSYFETIHQGGFDFVRVVLQAFAHMDLKNQLDPKWLATLDRVVAEASAAHLSVIIDEHDFNRCSDDPDACEPKLIAFWQQVAPLSRCTQYRTVRAAQRAARQARRDALECAARQALPLVRATNPNRTLVIGPAHWNSLSELPSLDLPAQDRNIIITFHYYEPFRFTHQGARWVEETKNLNGIPLTAEDEARIGHDFDQVAAWSKAATGRCCLASSVLTTRAARRSPTARATPARSAAMPSGRLCLGLLAVRRRFHPLRHRPRSLGRAYPRRAYRLSFLTR